MKRRVRGGGKTQVSAAAATVQGGCVGGNMKGRILNVSDTASAAPSLGETEQTGCRSAGTASRSGAEDQCWYQNESLLVFQRTEQLSSKSEMIRETKRNEVLSSRVVGAEPPQCFWPS